MTTAVVYLAYDPDTVRPGWIALIIVALLGLATFLLWRSMNTQLRKIKVPPSGAATSAASSEPPASGAAADGTAPDAASPESAPEGEAQPGGTDGEPETPRD